MNIQQIPSNLYSYAAGGMWGMVGVLTAVQVQVGTF